MTIDEAEKIKTVVENKDYITQLVNTVAKTMIEAFENLNIEDVNMFQLGYNKAIDDLIEAAEKSQYGDVDGKEYVMEHLKALAERLKAGGENEQSI